MSKSTYSRADRVADQIRMEVADILMRKIKDPRVRSVTVTDVRVDEGSAHRAGVCHDDGAEQRRTACVRRVGEGERLCAGGVGAAFGLAILPEVIFMKDVSGPRRIGC